MVAVVMLSRHRSTTQWASVFDALVSAGLMDEAAEWEREDFPALDCGPLATYRVYAPRLEATAPDQHTCSVFAGYDDGTRSRTFWRGKWQSSDECPCTYCVALAGR